MAPGSVKMGSCKHDLSCYDVITCSQWSSRNIYTLKSKPRTLEIAPMSSTLGQQIADVNRTLQKHKKIIRSTSAGERPLSWSLKSCSSQAANQVRVGSYMAAVITSRKQVLGQSHIKHKFCRYMMHCITLSPVLSLSLLRTMCSMLVLIVNAFFEILCNVERIFLLMAALDCTFESRKDPSKNAGIGRVSASNRSSFRSLKTE